MPPPPPGGRIARKYDENEYSMIWELQSSGNDSGKGTDQEDNLSVWSSVKKDLYLVRAQKLISCKEGISCLKTFKSGKNFTFTEDGGAMSYQPCEIHMKSARFHEIHQIA